MIFYFSATGNSQYIAQRLAEVTGETLVSITECLKNHKYTWELLPAERVGFVTPVYFFGLPSIVSEFIRNLDLCVRGQHFVYHVVTFGTITGQSHYMMEKALRKKGLNLDGRYIVKMVDTYTLMFDLSDEEKCEKVMKDAEVCIDRVIEKVVNRVRGDFDNRKIPHWLAFPYTYCNRKKSTAPFVALGRCIGCGACAKKCPMGAIEMRDNRPIWIKEQCLQCLGCLHRCPVFAIQYGKKTIKHGQFVHPGVKM